MREKVKFLEEQLNELRLHAEREHREEGNTLSLLQHEMKAANTERYTLHCNIHVCMYVCTYVHCSRVIGIRRLGLPFLCHRHIHEIIVPKAQPEGLLEGIHGEDTKKGCSNVLISQKS